MHLYVQARCTCAHKHEHSTSSKSASLSSKYRNSSTLILVKVSWNPVLIDCFRLSNVQLIYSMIDDWLFWSRSCGLPRFKCKLCPLDFRQLSDHSVQLWYLMRYFLLSVDADSTFWRTWFTSHSFCSSVGFTTRKLKPTTGSFGSDSSDSSMTVCHRAMFGIQCLNCAELSITCCCGNGKGPDYCRGW